MMNLLRQLKAAYRQSRASSEDGVAILLTVMLVSGIIIISVTVGFFVMQEVRNARSSSLTEPAIVAAESAGEQGLFQAKRGTFEDDCGETAYTQLDGTTTGGTANTRIKKCVATVPVVFQIPDDDPLQVLLYDPLAVDSNTCMEEICPWPSVPVVDEDGLGGGEQVYESLVLRHVSGGTLDVDIESFDGLWSTSGILTSGETESFNFPSNLPLAVDERLIIVLTPASTDVTVEVGTTGQYLGLPNYRTIDAEGCVGLANITTCDSTEEIYKRRINITLTE